MEALTNNWLAVAATALVVPLSIVALALTITKKKYKTHEKGIVVVTGASSGVYYQ